MKTFKYYTFNSLSCFRKKWGLSQQQIAEQMQISRSLVSMIEHGHRPLPTNILLQLAQLEIRLAGINIKATDKNICGDPGITEARCKRHCCQLSERETHCRAKAVKLRGKLESMTVLYQKTAGWMDVIALHIKEAGDNNPIPNPWKKQEITAMRTLNRCNLPSQQLLGHTVALLEEEAEIYKNKQLQVKQDLAYIILPNQETTIV